MFDDLRQFIDFLEERGELRRVKVPVSAELEITEITDRISKSDHNVALLFENVTGYEVPVLINALGSERRMAWALGLESLDELSARLEKLLAMDVPHSVLDKLRRLGDLLEVSRYGPKMVKKAPCQEVIESENPSLAPFPVLKCWPEDGGPFVTLPLVISRDPASGRRNVGMYRLQVYDERTTGMHWHLHKGGAAHYRHSEGKDERLEVAVALGGDPATIYAATAPLPPDIDEFLLAGWLRRAPLELVKCVSVDLEVPAHSEIVLEGYVEPGERRLEGPFGDHTGYYSLADTYPVFHITAITHRTDPIYPATVVGRPPMEDAYLGKATERLFLPLVRLMLPEIVDINMPPEGVFHNLVIVSIKKDYPGQARKAMYGLWGLGQLMFAKNIVVVDEGVNVHDLSEVAWRVTNNIDPRRDVIIVDGPLDALDHAAPQAYYGSKMGIDATAKGPLDGHPREWPRDIVMSEDVKQLVDKRWEEYGI
jgi:4-hydroxy-3-polyprenylbenzoate decarboxylase